MGLIVTEYLEDVLLEYTDHSQAFLTPHDLRRFSQKCYRGIVASHIILAPMLSQIFLASCANLTVI
jgi:hypothetical protein